jgi:hypothetical protein
MSEKLKKTESVRTLLIYRGKTNRPAKRAAASSLGEKLNVPEWVDLF